MATHFKMMYYCPESVVLQMKLKSNTEITHYVKTYKSGHC